jgi:hypothetical protein
METLMPCGKVSLSALSIIGAGEFQTYKKRCVFNDCETRIWRGREACGFESIFGMPCPTEANKTASEWRRWEKKLRGVNEEGKEFYSLEWVPAHGNREQQWGELLPAIKETVPHVWRQQLMQQSVRVYEDRKSGRHLDELKKRRRLLTTPPLLADAMDMIVLWAEERLEPPALSQPSSLSRLVATLRAVKRLANAIKLPLAAAIKEATQVVATAQEVFDSLSRTVTMQSDYASQLETSREFHATCATKERHNYLVTLMCYGSLKKTRARPRKAPPRRRRVQQTPYERPASRISVEAEPCQRPSSRYPAERDGRQTVDYKQNVDVHARHLISRFSCPSPLVLTSCPSPSLIGGATLLLAGPLRFPQVWLQAQRALLQCRDGGRMPLPQVWHSSPRRVVYRRSTRPACAWQPSAAAALRLEW